MNKKKVVFGLIGLTATVAGFVAKVFYRDYIYTNDIQDFGFAGAMPSLFYVIGFSQFLLIKPPVRPWLIVSVVALASCMFEFMQYASAEIMDVADVLASVAGGFVSFVIWKYVEKKMNKIGRLP